MSTLAKINESIAIYRYNNGFMVEANGRDEEGDWFTEKMVFDSADSAYEYAKQLHTTLPLDN